MLTIGDTFVIFIQVTAKPDFVCESKFCKYSLCIHFNRNKIHSYEILSVLERIDIVSIAIDF